MKTKILLSAIALLASSASMADVTDDFWNDMNIFGNSQNDSTGSVGSVTSDVKQNVTGKGNTTGSTKNSGSAPTEFVSQGGGITFPSLGAKTAPTVANDANMEAAVDSAFDAGYTNGFKDGVVALKQKIDSNLRAAEAAKAENVTP
jgi:hypothetical protein